jgi:hypothetical protein
MIHAGEQGPWRGWIHVFSSNDKITGKGAFGQAGNSYASSISWMVSEGHGGTTAFVRQPPAHCQANPGHRSQFIAGVFTANSAYRPRQPPAEATSACPQDILPLAPWCGQPTSQHLPPARWPDSHS